MKFNSFITFLVILFVGLFGYIVYFHCEKAKLANDINEQIERMDSDRVSRTFDGDTITFNIMTKDCVSLSVDVVKLEFEKPVNYEDYKSCVTHQLRLYYNNVLYEDIKDDDTPIFMKIKEFSNEYANIRGMYFYQIAFNPIRRPNFY